METFLNIAIPLGFLVALGSWHYQHIRNGRWHEYTSIPRGTVMRRRRPDGTWEYRSLTDAEDVERQGFKP
ncbi:hypothetical protein [Bradyrhizobium sp. LA2.1]|uniref:hypothetical protein n=1 Tax=Bradyrhizobium sp. LA2.1 TaxID=3156376 RepID=UPI0033959AEA